MIYGTMRYFYKFGTEFYSRDSAMECFNKWLDVGRTPEEESAALKPEWDEFARRNNMMMYGVVLELLLTTLRT